MGSLGPRFSIYFIYISALTFHTISAQASPQALGDGEEPINANAWIAPEQSMRLRDLNLVEPDELTLDFSMAPVDVDTEHEFIKRARSKRKFKRRRGITDPMLGAWVNMFRTAAQFVQGLDRERTGASGIHTDVRYAYVHWVDKYSGENYAFGVQGEYERITSVAESVYTRSQTGGLGVRVDYTLHPRAKLIATLFPVYIEHSSIQDELNQVNPLSKHRSAWDVLLRTSVGLAGSFQVGERLEPGFQIFYQPQVLDLSQYRVLVQWHVGIKLLDEDWISDFVRRYTLIEQIVMKPTFFYSRSTDETGILGRDVFQTLKRDHASDLGNNVHGFLNLDIKVRLPKSLSR